MYGAFGIYVFVLSQQPPSLCAYKYVHIKKQDTYPCYYILRWDKHLFAVDCQSVLLKTCTLLKKTRSVLGVEFLADYLNFWEGECHLEIMWFLLNKSVLIILSCYFNVKNSDKANRRYQEMKAEGWGQGEGELVLVRTDAENRKNE